MLGLPRSVAACLFGPDGVHTTMTPRCTARKPMLYDVPAQRAEHDAETFVPYDALFDDRQHLVLKDLAELLDRS